MSLLQLISRVTWHGFLQFADDTIYACGHNLRLMQLLGARTCTQLPFVLGSNNTCCSVVTVLG